MTIFFWFEPLFIDMRKFNFFKRDHLLSRKEFSPRRFKNTDAAYEKGKRIIETMKMKLVPAVNRYIHNFYKLLGGLLNEECWFNIMICSTDYKRKFTNQQV